ncbi:hypothetical protein QVD17_06879 [Tagetes erecta]|uniref:Integrase catalytic domain-containing protein n=1 Tax=Tagetes erecta TaxID=13708 RepID=A0AAD8LGT4_TARER|nr:hypothetical protein QVD17_06879 [Tagetes erecta]
MDLFGPTNVQSIGKKSYCLVIIDDFTRFSWVYFLHVKSETAELLKEFIIKVENQLDCKVKILRSDNGTEFKNSIVDLFCAEKGIARHFSAPRTPQHNGVAKQKNQTLIEVARSMLADAKISITFWDEAIATACFVQNRTLLVQDKHKTSYELLFGRKPNISYLKAFGCPVSILNLSDHLGKTKKESGDLGCFSDDSNNDDDNDLNSEYPFMSFHNPNNVSSKQAPGPSGSQEDQESNNLEDDVNQQNSPNDGGSVHTQPSSDPNVEIYRI